MAMRIHLIKSLGAVRKTLWEQVVSESYQADQDSLALWDSWVLPPAGGQCLPRSSSLAFWKGECFLPSSPPPPLIRNPHQSPKISCCRELENQVCKNLKIPFKKTNLCAKLHNLQSQNPVSILKKHILLVFPSFSSLNLLTNCQWCFFLCSLFFFFIYWKLGKQTKMPIQVFYFHVWRKSLCM